MKIRLKDDFWNHKDPEYYKEKIQSFSYKYALFSTLFVGIGTATGISLLNYFFIGLTLVMSAIIYRTYITYKQGDKE